MREDKEKPETDVGEEKPAADPDSSEKWFWWGGSEITFVGTMDL